MFNLTIKGETETLLPADLRSPTSVFGKAWKNFQRELDNAGVKITAAEIDTAGQKTVLPIEVHAVA